MTNPGNLGPRRDDPRSRSWIGRRTVVAALVAVAGVVGVCCSEPTGPRQDPAPAEAGGQVGATTTSGENIGCSSLTPGAILCGMNASNPSTTRWRAVSTGDEHTCGLRADGALFCWGSNRDGQLGIPSVSQRCGAGASYPCSLVPVRSEPGMLFTAVSAGARHTCGITSSLEAVCWGANDAGQLGGAAGSGSSPSTVPTAAPGHWAQISAGFSHSCAVRSTGAVFCWGANERGQLGNGSTQPSTAPVAASIPEPATSVSAGQSRTCALGTSGTVYCWGAVWMNRNGGFEMTRSQTTPEAVPGAPTMRGVSVGVFTTCGVDVSGAARCWEGNPRGQMGTGTREGSATPAPVAGSLAFLQVSAGLVQSCGVTAGGTAYCWGDGSFGQLGTDPARLAERCDVQALPCATSPLPVASSVQFTQLATGFGSHVCAISADAAIYCWGLGAAGQRGDGSISSVQFTPTRITLPSESER